MRPLVYIETTIPSYYTDTRTTLANGIARTRQWWDLERHEYDCFISQVVLDELEVPVHPTREECLALVKDLPLLAISNEIIDIADVYQRQKVMPGPPSADALHLAIAAYYKVDYLLTWNCRHLANARKARHLEQINLRLRLATPRLVTPHQLFLPGEADE